jgi:hypothetical protein
MSYTYNGFARKMAGASAALRPEAERLLIIRMEAMKALAKSYPGSYQEGWAPLADATVSRRERAGWSGDDPLLRSGAYRDSIEVRYTPGLRGVLYSNHPGARLMELGGTGGHGTHTPPRPVITLAARKMRGIFLAELNALLAEVVESA